MQSRRPIELGKVRDEEFRRRQGFPERFLSNDQRVHELVKYINYQLTNSMIFGILTCVKIPPLT